MERGDSVKENKVAVLPLSWHWVVAGLALSAAAMLAVARIDYDLPTPLTRAAPADRFIAEIAHEHLVNLTSIGPRVAGSYENEVASVALLVAAVRSIAAQASPHNRVELDVHRASGNFSLSFMDGMNNVYRDVQSVVVRVSGAGGRPPPPHQHAPRRALLLNCHFDTVPDSPGASDDGAGCAVLLETLRALAAARRPLRHDAVFLFNGAEENILQASHAFITQHKWAASVRAFINIEACGAGGREVLFQAGPHDPWIVEVYAGVVPHPFASSLAQELFESGLIPADTDFRIFRDFGKLSGVDLAWSANGYVYHTRLDTADGVPPAALQRTGDNVLALAHGLLASESVESAVDESSRQPVFFDVLGRCVVSARAPAAAALCGVTLALLGAKLWLSAAHARRRLYVARAAWAGAVLRAAAGSLLAGAGGVLAAAAVAALLHALGARLSFYARPLLLAPLFVAPGAAACWALAARLARGGAAPARGWWRARAWHDAQALLAGALLLLCAARGLRSGFLPLLWALLPALADVLATLTRLPRPACWVAGALLPLLQTCYLLLNSLHMFVPIMGRAGSGPLPPDVTMAIITSTLVLAALSWLLPFVVVGRDLSKPVWWLVGTCACACALVLTTPLGDAYSAARPQRLMVFHTRRTVHPLVGPEVTENFYWVPELDANTAATLDKYVGGSTMVSAAECVQRVYCGAPYYLPVLGLVARSHRAPAAQPPRARLAASLSTRRHAAGATLTVRVTSAPQHVVLIVAPARGVQLAACSVLARPLPAAWAGTGRSTYFVLLHAAREPAAWSVTLELRTEAPAGPLCDVSLAGHAMFGADKLHAEHARLLDALPPSVAATGWGVDLHLYHL